jgi:hypothetical protein
MTKNNMPETPHDASHVEFFSKIQTELELIILKLDDNYINNESAGYRIRTKEDLLKKSLKEAVFWLKND